MKIKKIWAIKVYEEDDNRYNVFICSKKPLNGNQGYDEQWNFRKNTESTLIYPNAFYEIFGKKFPKDSDIMFLTIS